MTDAPQKTFTLTNDQTGESTKACRFLDGNDGPSVIDVRKLYGQTGPLHLRPGFPGHGLL